MTPQTSSDQAPVQVSVNNGIILGKHQPASTTYPKPLDIFYGIPYATAERFRVARPCVPVESGDVKDARSEGAYVPCPMADFETEEGVLRLNIFRTGSVHAESGGEDNGKGTTEKKEDAMTENAKVPVMIYIHGGAYMFSYPLERNLASLVSWAPQDILIVAVGYRLGALGFKSEGQLNLGLRDQRTAVEWVTRWIGAFGGGTDITLMGVSAGAHSVSFCFSQAINVGEN